MVTDLHRHYYIFCEDRKPTVHNSNQQSSVDEDDNDNNSKHQGINLPSQLLQTGQIEEVGLGRETLPINRDQVMGCNFINIRMKDTTEFLQWVHTDGPRHPLDMPRCRIR
jgi:hypothetical protein